MSDQSIQQQKKCETCGQIFVRKSTESYAYFAIKRFCKRTCQRPKLKPDSELKSRYRQTKVNGKKVNLHRAMAEKSLGRKLESTELVHHVDENKLNNTPDNFEIVSAAEHGLRHQKYPSVKICVICGAEFTPHKTKRKRQQVCSKPCKTLLVSRRLRKPEGEFSNYNPDAPPSRAVNRIE